MEKDRLAGATPAQIEARTREMAEFKVMYGNPVINIALTFLEPLPVGLLIALVCAGALRRQRAGMTLPQGA